MSQAYRAKAACRMRNASKAKHAFDQLSVGQRRGIRGECRDNGVRQGGIAQRPIILPNFALSVGSTASLVPHACITSEYEPMSNP